MASKFGTWQKSKLRSGWQRIKQPKGVAAIIIVVVIGLIIAGYWFDWTGFNGYNKVTTARTIGGPSAGAVTRTEEYQPGKSLWDWLQLLFIPAVLTLGAVWISSRQSHDLEITADNQRETALQAYIEKMSELLIKEHLGELTPERKPKPEYEGVRNIARVRTLAVLPLLDPRRKRSVFQFLHESGLIVCDPYAIIPLSGGDLRRADLHDVDLSNAELSGANLEKANLNHAVLFSTILNGAILTKADLRGADLNGAILSAADLSGVDLRDAYLDGADLSGSGPRDAKPPLPPSRLFVLSGANLSGANLSGANLSGANLHWVDLSGANLSGANLSHVKVTSEQLARAKSLKGAIMPDGSIHP